MIDQFNDDLTGWARFSDDMTMRYRLARVLSGGVEKLALEGEALSWVGGPFMKRGVFLMLNPSTADAFKPDPTVTECMKRSIAVGADLLEVVNLFAWRSQYPADLKKRSSGARGDDEVNTAAIFAACRGAQYVVAAWGNDGYIGGRAAIVRHALREFRIPLYHFGLTKDGHPKHPLARGKHRIPADLQMEEWRP